MTTFYLIRHGDKIKELGNPGLSVLGKEQAQKTAEHLQNLSINAIYTSPLKRTKETADIIAEKLDLEVTDEPLLLERMNWEIPNQPFDEFLKEWEYATAHPEWKPTAGDSVQETANRMREIIKKLSAIHKNAQVVLVTHGGTIRDFLTTFFPEESKILAERKQEGIVECSITTVIAENDYLKIAKFDSNDHLQ